MCAVARRVSEGQRARVGSFKARTVANPHTHATPIRTDLVHREGLREEAVDHLARDRARGRLLHLEEGTQTLTARPAVLDTSVRAHLAVVEIEGRVDPIQDLLAPHEVRLFRMSNSVSWHVCMSTSFAGWGLPIVLSSQELTLSIIPIVWSAIF